MWGLLLLVQVVDTAGLPEGGAAPTGSPFLEGWNSLFTMISAVSALAAVFLAAREATLSRLERKADTIRELYSRVVVSSVLPEVTKYCKDTDRIIKERLAPLRDEGSTSLQHEQVLRQVRALIAECNEGFYQLRISIMGPVEGWSDEELTAAVNDILYRLQDALNLRLASIETPSHGGHGARQLLLEDTCRLTRLLVQYDPVKRRIAPR